MHMLLLFWESKRREVAWAEGLSPRAPVTRSCPGCLAAGAEVAALAVRIPTALHGSPVSWRHKHWDLSVWPPPLKPLTSFHFLCLVSSWEDWENIGAILEFSVKCGWRNSPFSVECSPIEWPLINGCPIPFLSLIWSLGGKSFPNLGKANNPTSLTDAKNVDVHGICS